MLVSTVCFLHKNLFLTNADSTSKLFKVYFALFSVSLTMLVRTYRKLIHLGRLYSNNGLMMRKSKEKENKTINHSINYTQDNIKICLIHR